MKTIKSSLLVLLFVISSGFAAHAQSEGSLSVPFMQFYVHFMGTQDDFEKLHGEKSSENEEYIYYNSEKLLGSKTILIAQNKKDLTLWIYYVEYSMDTELSELMEVQPAIFKVLNDQVGAGKIKGEETTEGNITKTNLYTVAKNEWLGELVTDNENQKFYVLLANTKF